MFARISLDSLYPRQFLQGHVHVFGIMSLNNPDVTNQ